MGILSRFRDLMASNIHAMLDKADNPERTIDDFMRSLNDSLGQVRAETASVLAEERRARRDLDDCRSEIAKLQRYAEKSAEAGNESEARKFLERKAAVAEKEARLQSAYELATGNAARMKQLEEKLVADMAQLEARRSALKEKLAAAENQRKRNAAGTPTGGDIDSVFRSMEEKAEQAYDEAMAIAELRAGAKGGPDDDLDAQIEELKKRAELRDKNE